MHKVEVFNERKHKVLIVDDVDNNRRILNNFLVKHNYETEIACNGEEALEMAKKFVPDLILLDVMMPVMDGYEVCRRLKSDNELNDIPVIFVTAKNQQEDIVKGFKVGGNDYIGKPFYFDEVLMRIKVHIENKLFKEKLFNFSMTDPLTGLWNRRYFLERANNEIFRAIRYSNLLSFIIFDVDDFKKVNDRYGHDAGDDVLVGIAERVKNNIRGTDYICRWGGEEFVIMLVNASLACAATISEKLCAIISKEEFNTRKGVISATISLGVSSSLEFEVDKLNVDSLCLLADKRLYVAKNTGKNKVVFN